MDIVEQRVRLLDDALTRLGGDARGELDVVRFTSVLQKATPVSPVPADRFHDDPSAADQLVRTSVLLQRMAAANPSLAVGPIDRTNQYWLGTARHRLLGRETFIDVSTAAFVPSAKPFGVGLFTSTGGAGDFGMWHRLVWDTGDGSLFPAPYAVFRMVVDEAARVLEITSATDWCALVSDHHINYGGFAYPDWKAIAADYDGVHLSLLAIAAAQGVAFRVDGLTTGPAYWDVESSFWLHWCFADVSEIAVTGG
jgi:hypothetical protein